LQPGYEGFEKRIFTGEKAAGITGFAWSGPRSCLFLDEICTLNAKITQDSPL
jgi:hypothetical protein